MTIETPRAKQRRIENLRTIGRSKDDDTGARIESIHLHKKLIEGLLSLFIAGESRHVWNEARHASKRPK
jgi:hypothetical protein